MTKDSENPDNTQEQEESENEERLVYRNMLHPSVENLVDKAGSKFLLVSLVAERTKDINTYYQGLGSGMAGVAPPQVTGDYSSYLSISFEEIAQGKTVLSREKPVEDLPEDLPEMDAPELDTPELETPEIQAEET